MDPFTGAGAEGMLDPFTEAGAEEIPTTWRLRIAARGREALIYMVLKTL